MGGAIETNQRVGRVADAVAKVLAVDKAALYGEGRRNRWETRINIARALTAYICVVDLKLSNRQVGDALGYSANGSGVYNAVYRLARAHGLPRPTETPWLSGKRLAWAGKAPTGPKPDPNAPPKAVIAPRQVPVKPRAPKPEPQSLPIATPAARHAVPHHSLGRMATPASPAPTTVSGLSDRILAFLENRRAATAQTLATCLGAKELTVSQSLSLLKHHGQVANDAPAGTPMRDTLWRIAALEGAV